MVWQPVPERVKNEDKLKNESDLTNQDDYKTEDDLKKKDVLKHEDNHQKFLSWRNVLLNAFVSAWTSLDPNY